MSLGFKKFVNDWVLYMPALLLMRIDQGRAMVEDAEDQAILERMVKHYNQELGRPNMDNGGRLKPIEKATYIGKQFLDRFKVVETSMGGKFYLFDETERYGYGGMARRSGPDSPTLLFDSIEEAEAHGHKVAGKPKPTTTPSLGRGEAKRAAKPAPVEKPVVVKAPKADKPTTPRARKPSVSGRMQELILAGGRTDDEIWAIVQAEFQLPDTKKSYVAWNRKFLIKEGKL